MSFGLGRRLSRVGPSGDAPAAHPGTLDKMYRLPHLPRANSPHSLHDMRTATRRNRNNSFYINPLTQTLRAIRADNRSDPRSLV